MNRVLVCAASCLLVLLLIPATASSGLGKPMLPYKYWAGATMVINIDPGSPDYGRADYSDHGVATYLGQFTNVATGTFDLATGAVAGVGVITTARGDKVYWTIDDLWGPDMQAIVNGGTGRFLGATGLLSDWQNTNESQVIDWPYLIISYDTVASGWISF